MDGFKIAARLNQLETEPVSLRSLRLTCHTLRETVKFVGYDKFARANAGTPITDTP